MYYMSVASRTQARLTALLNIYNRIYLYPVAIETSLSSNGFALVGHSLRMDSSKENSMRLEWQSAF